MPPPWVRGSWSWVSMTAPRVANFPASRCAAGAASARPCPVTWRAPLSPRWACAWIRWSARRSSGCCPSPPRDDPPYLLARRVSASMPAGGGWIRRGTQARRLLRRHLQGIFAARFARDEVGEITVGFPGDLPRDELELAPLPSRPCPRRRRRRTRGTHAAGQARGQVGAGAQRLAHCPAGPCAGQWGGHAVPGAGHEDLMVMLDKIPLGQAAADVITSSNSGRTA